MLRIVFRVKDFLVQSLALLPRKIRQKLLLGLSLADILHLDGTTLFDDEITFRLVTPAIVFWILL